MKNSIRNYAYYYNRKFDIMSLFTCKIVLYHAFQNKWKFQIVFHILAISVGVIEVLGEGKEMVQ